MFRPLHPRRPRFDVAALNFRGCSGELGKYPLGYHLGFTDDLLHVVSTAYVTDGAKGTWCKRAMIETYLIHCFAT